MRIEPNAESGISLTVNGRPISTRVDVRRSLADFLREDLGLTGTHLGCEHGVCGACTVILGGDAVRSCLMLAIQADGGEVTTIEGLSDNGELSTLQRAFHESHGFQCAFCAPGFLLTTKVLLDTNPNPSRDQIREELSGNLCRCTGYHSIIASVETAVTLMSEADNA